MNQIQLPGFLGFQIFDWLMLLVLVILVFLVLREFFTWYWKVNKAIRLLEKIEENTRGLKTHVANVSGQESGVPPRNGPFTD